MASESPKTAATNGEADDGEAQAERDADSSQSLHERLRALGQADPTTLADTPTRTPRRVPPFVLEAIADGPQLREEPTVIVCPGCGTPIATYETGLPDSVVQFREECPDCDLEIRRWSALAITPAFATVAPCELFAEVTQAYWDRRLWAGATTSGHPRNAEYTRAFTDRAKAYGWDWTVTCPLCRRSLDRLPGDRLDYHHWTREPDDQGVCLCRACHEAINAGQYDEALDWQARELGLGGKHDLQLARLAARETLIGTHAGLAGLARTLVERYNAPYEPAAVAAILEQALTDPTVREALTDDTLQKGVHTDD